VFPASFINSILLGKEPGEIPKGSAKRIGSRGNGGMMEKLKRQRKIWKIELIDGIYNHFYFK